MQHGTNWAFSRPEIYSCHPLAGSPTQTVAIPTVLDMEGKMSIACIVLLSHGGKHILEPDFIPNATFRRKRYEL